MKLIMWIVLGYIAYRYVLKPKRIAERNSRASNEPKPNNRKGNNDNEDYIDYEEVD